MKAKLIFIIPKPGLKVIDPMTRKPIDSKGEHVEKTTYWQRRIKCGDVVVGEEKAVVVEETINEIEEQQLEDVGGDE